MNLNTDTIRKLTDYVLLNSYSLTSAGLYIGRAGHSLCLFEMARFLNDEELENHAFELLQEALVAESDKIDFGHGECGIGYTLLYLIRHQLINADFTEFFGQKKEKIFFTIQNVKNRLYFLTALPFLIEYAQLFPNDPEAPRLIERILNDSLTSIENSLSAENWHNEQNKNVRIQTLKSIFRGLYLLETHQLNAHYDADKLKQVVQNVTGLYQLPGMPRLYEVDFYAGRMAALSPLPFGANDPKRQIDFVYSQTLDLETTLRLNTMQMLSPAPYAWPDNPLNGMTDAGIESFFHYRIAHKQSICSFQSGVARFLLYYLYTKEYSSTVAPNRLADLLI